MALLALALKISDIRFITLIAACAPFSCVCYHAQRSHTMPQRTAFVEISYPGTVFNRRSAQDKAPDAATSTSTTVEEKQAGKGRPTPKRRDATPTRRPIGAVARTRREEARLQRAAPARRRARAQAAMAGKGDDK